MKTTLHNHINDCIREIENEYPDVITLVTEREIHLQGGFNDFIQILGEKYDGSISNVGYPITVHMACMSSYKLNREIYEKYGYTPLGEDDPCVIKDYEWEERATIADEVEEIIIAIGGEEMANAFKSHKEYEEYWSQVKQKEEEKIKKEKKIIKRLNAISIIIPIITALFLILAILAGWY